jgi:2Fe-2S ferredoxin
VDSAWIFACCDRFPNVCSIYEPNGVAAVWQVRYVQQDGTECVIGIASGISVMLAAVRNGVSGIEGECGGCLDCATCHVYVDEAQMHALPLPGDDELELLGNVAAPRKPNSRLRRQLKPPFPTETLTVYVPEVQS